MTNTTLLNTPKVQRRPRVFTKGSARNGRATDNTMKLPANLAVERPQSQAIGLPWLSRMQSPGGVVAAYASQRSQPRPTSQSRSVFEGSVMFPRLTLGLLILQRYFTILDENNMLSPQSLVGGGPRERLATPPQAEACGYIALWSNDAEIVAVELIAVAQVPNQNTIWPLRADEATAFGYGGVALPPPHGAPFSGGYVPHPPPPTPLGPKTAPPPPLTPRPALLP